MAYQAMREILAKCEKEQIEFWEAVQRDDMEEREVTKEASWEKMKFMWKSMVTAAENYDKNLISESGLSGGGGGKMDEYRETGKPLCGDFVSRVISQALKMAESNACMKRIVAAPTAGACGVLPAVLVTYMESEKADEAEIIKALFTAAGIGQIIATRAFIAGASGGCQAEIGTAASMAAGAMVSLRGGSSQMIADAAAMAMKNFLGLVCDPAAGLVEIPCIKRNVAGAVNALACADMALAGIESRIPADEIFDAMREIGLSMGDEYKETSRGGIAATDTAKKIQIQIQQ